MRPTSQMVVITVYTSSSLPGKEFSFGVSWLFYCHKDPSFHGSPNLSLCSGYPCPLSHIVDSIVGLPRCKFSSWSEPVLSNSASSSVPLPFWVLCFLEAVTVGTAEIQIRATLFSKFCPNLSFELFGYRWWLCRLKIGTYDFQILGSVHPCFEFAVSLFNFSWILMAIILLNTLSMKLNIFHFQLFSMLVCFMLMFFRS